MSQHSVLFDGLLGSGGQENVQVALRPDSGEATGAKPAAGNDQFFVKTMAPRSRQDQPSMADKPDVAGVEGSRPLWYGPNGDAGELPVRAGCPDLRTQAAGAIEQLVLCPQTFARVC